MSAGIIIKEKKGVKLGSLTRLRAEEESKRRMQEEMYLVDTLGGDTSDLRSRDEVVRHFQETEALEKGFRDEAMQILLGLRKSTHDYNSFLDTVLQRFIEQESIPKKFQIVSKPNDVGVVVSIAGTKYYGAFKASGIPPYDYHACKLLAVKLGNTVAKLMGYTRQTEGGIILPDEEDLKKYSHGRPRTNQ